MGFVALAYLLSWTIWGVGALTNPDFAGMQDPRFQPWLLAGSFGPSAAALIVARLSGGRDGLRRLLASAVRVRAPIALWAVILFALPAIGSLFAVLLGLPATLPLGLLLLTMVVAAPINGLLGGVVFGVGPLGEELGWRGWLGNRLGVLHSPLRTAVVVGVAWSFWHLPLFWSPSFRLELPVWSFVPSYTLSLMLASFIMAHAWRASRGSLPMAMMFNGVMNVTAGGSVGGWEHSHPYGPMALMLAALAGTALVIARLAPELSARITNP
jgi:membrane protease YdiL (CAAX protease family)